MITDQLTKKVAALLTVWGLYGAAYAGQTDISTMPLNTYSAASSTDVKPNVLFVLDDSGSMFWDFLPDWACSDNDSTTLYLPSPYGQQVPCNGGPAEVAGAEPPQYLFKNSGYNGLAYNPAQTYSPPVKFASDGTLQTFPSMNGTTTSTGADSSSKPNWKAVPNDGFGVQTLYSTTGTPHSTTTSNLVNDADDPSNAYHNHHAFAYVTVPGEYCTSASLRKCVDSTVPTTSGTDNYSYPASLRWCDSTMTNCKATFDPTYKYARSPSPRTATITVSGTSSTSVSSVKVNGVEILSASVAASTSSSTIASGIATQINACSNGIPSGSNCGTVGYTASASGSIVTIYAPAAISYTPVVTKSGTMTLTATAFAQGTYKGEILRTTITPSVNSYPYPGTSAKASTRTDCAGTTCTYAEEMTNYANWWAYYHTRMQMMKSGVTLAFSNLDSAADMTSNVSRFRVGYMSIDNAAGNYASPATPQFLNVAEFNAAQRYAWYNKFLAAIPGGGTPLRTALSTAGRMYAGKLNSQSVYGVTVSDPLQYSCQQNYTILSTDGFWNSGAGSKMDGSTAVGNQDGTDPPPYWDGTNVQNLKSTSTLQSRTVSTQAQSQTSTLQTRTGQLQKQTKSGGSWSSWSNVSSCSPGSSTRCQYNWGGWTDATASCTPHYSSGSSTWNIAIGTDCQYTSWTAWSDTASCSPAGQSTSAPYTQLTATQCQNVTSYGSWIPVSSCTASSTRQCSYTSWSSYSNVSSCTAVPQSTGPNYTVGTAVQCSQNVSGGTSDTLADVAAYYYKTDLRSSTAANGTGTCTGPIISPNTTPNDLCTDNVPSYGRDTATYQHMTTFTLGLGAQGAMVYAPNDGVNYWNDQSGDFYDVEKKSSPDSATGICSWQSSGQCYWPVPVASSTGAYTNVDDLWHAAVNGHGSYFSARDPKTLSTALTNTLSTIVNTPRPGTAAAAASSNPNVSASDNYVFSSSYRSVDWYGELIRQQITDTGALTAQNWSAMRLLDCTTTPWQANNAYKAGNVFRQGTQCYVVNTDYVSGSAFDSSASGADYLNTSVINADETATVKTPAVAQTSRTIYTKGSTGLIPFQWSNLVSEGLSSYFTAPAITYNSSVTPTTGLSQFCSSGGTCLSGSQQSNNTIATGGAAGEALVNYLRGDRTYELTYYRQRAHVLGDIVSSEARYVQKPLFNYSDPGYSDFQTLQASRTGAVYVGGNDGMVHAFNATSGQEMWAYIPSMVLPNIYMLADKNYSTQHQFFVDGTPETGDICPNAPSSACAGTDWKTILVGGLNRGGMGFYALDITDPASPKFLWEFTNSSLNHATQGYLGYSYSNPRITKLKDGTWVVIVASGYNNTNNGTTDGVGRIYVLNANTGSIIQVISTGVGSSTSPSGLARISAHVLESDTDNTATAVYGGDTFGNLWRFDINGDIGAGGYDAQLLVTFLDSSGTAQPITVKPLEATINGYPVVFAGTGKYLGTTDIANTQKESFYAVMDKLGSTTYGNPRVASSNFVQQTLTAGTCPAGTPLTVCSPSQIVRTSSNNAVDWTIKNGWYVDFLTAGERSVTDPALGLGTLLFTTITPQSSSANACGADDPNASVSFLYALDYLTGGSVVGSNGVSGISLGSGLATRPVMIEQSDGTVRALVRTSGGSSSSSGTDLAGTTVATPPVKPPSYSGVQHISWRELPNSN